MNNEINNNINNDIQPNIETSTMENANQNEKFTLTLKRKKSFVACLISFNIYIDNQKVTKIKNGETVELSVPAGNH